MSIIPDDPQPLLRSTPKQLITRHPITVFLILVFTFVWGAMLPFIVSNRGFGLLPIDVPPSIIISAISILGLAIPTLLVTAIEGGKSQVQNLLRRCFRWKVGIRWYLIALFLLLLATLFLAVLFLGISPLQALTQNWILLFTVYLPGIAIPFVLINLWEELCWTGFLQSRLQTIRGPLLASLLTAPAFALIHLPTYFVVGWISEERVPLNQLPLVLIKVGVIALFAMFFRIIIMWLYNRTGYSIFIVALFHSAFNMVNGQTITLEFLHLPATLASLIPLAATFVLAILLVLSTKMRLAYKPERGVE